MDLPPITQLVIQELRQPRAYVVRSASEQGKVDGWDWGVRLDGASSSGTNVSVHLGHYAGDMPLLPDGALSSEIARDLERVAKSWRALPRT